MTIDFQKFTKCSAVRTRKLRALVREIVKKGVSQVVCECGVYKGGQMMAAANMLLQCKDLTRELYLFDTFDGMPHPGKYDIKVNALSPKAWHANWCRSPLEEVKANMALVKYPQEKIHYIKGQVEKTLTKSTKIPPIAILRLDMDFYEPTKHALEILYPKISKGGYLIIDDYGAWQGCRKAVDEYFGTKYPDFSDKTDFTMRVMRKQ